MSQKAFNVTQLVAHTQVDAHRVHPQDKDHIHHKLHQPIPIGLQVINFGAPNYIILKFEYIKWLEYYYQLKFSLQQGDAEEDPAK